MIDLHSHILPGLDDGAPDLASALAMARIAVRDEIRHCVCTPHIVPGLHPNTGLRISARLALFREALNRAEIPLKLSLGAEIHLTPDLIGGLHNGVLPCLGRGSAFLLELPSAALPPRVIRFIAALQAAGYRPVIAHPERLRWIEARADLLLALQKQGALMQITAGSLLGRFGSRARFWSEYMLDHGLVDVIATDAHDEQRRPPLLSAARDRAALWVGEAAAHDMVHGTPAALIAPRTEAAIDPRRGVTAFLPAGGQLSPAAGDRV